jgi:hypothetical protein
MSLQENIGTYLNSAATASVQILPNSTSINRRCTIQILSASQNNSQKETAKFCGSLGVKYEHGEIQKSLHYGHFICNKLRILKASEKCWTWAGNYCVFGPLPSSGILETRKNNVSETGSVSVLRWGGRHLLCWVPYKQVTQWLTLVLSKRSNWIGVVLLTWGRKQIQFPERYVF